MLNLGRYSVECIGRCTNHSDQGWWFRHVIRETLGVTSARCLYDEIKLSRSFLPSGRVKETDCFRNKPLHSNGVEVVNRLWHRPGHVSSEGQPQRYRRVLFPWWEQQPPRGVR